MWIFIRSYSHCINSLYRVRQSVVYARQDRQKELILEGGELRVKRVEIRVIGKILETRLFRSLENTPFPPIALVK